MAELLLHPETAHALERVAAHPVHAVLLEAPAGMGKTAIARQFAAGLLDISTNSLGTYPYYFEIAPEGTSISIEVVRTIQQRMYLKTLGTGLIRRIVLINDAHSMTTEAQNALLKLLEEPPEDTVMILTAQPEAGLLKTIKSRVLTIRLSQPEPHLAVEYFVELGYSKPEVVKALSIAENRPALTAALLASDQNHLLVSSIVIAKKILAADTFTRLSYIDKLVKQKQDIPSLLFGLERVTHVLMLRAAEQSKTAQLLRTKRSLGAIVQARANLAANPQPKLLLTDLFLQL